MVINLCWKTINSTSQASAAKADKERLSSESLPDQLGAKSEKNGKGQRAPEAPTKTTLKGPQQAALPGSRTDLEGRLGCERRSHALPPTTGHKHWWESCVEEEV